jgi:hypothetical protein
MKKFIVLFAAFAMVLAFAPAATADVDFYGSARMWTYMTSVDNTGAVIDTDDVRWDLGPFSRFGANFKNGDVRGKFELDVRDGDGSDGASTVGDMRLRHLFGEWNFGSGKLLVGQTWPLTDWAVTGLQYTGGGLQSYGSVGMTYARTSQIRLTFGNLKIAFMTPDIGLGGGGIYTNDTERTIPKMEVRYGFKFDPVSIDLLGGYQTYAAISATDSTEDIASYLAGVRVKSNFGAFYANFGANIAQNGGNYGMSNAVLTAATWDGNTLKDNDSFGACVALGFKMSDTMTFEIGYGMNSSEEDTAATNEDEAQAYYLLAKINLAPGVNMYPEIGVLDADTITVNGVESEQAETTFFGIVWKIDFK